MSLISQTSPTRNRTVFPRRLLPWAIAALALAVLALARPHTPDMEVFAKLSPAVRIHLVAALAALLIGGLLMTGRKGAVFHRVAGWSWVSLVALAAGSSLFIRGLNHGHFSWLHLLTGWVLVILPLAVFAARRRNIRQHRQMMTGLFLGGFFINIVFAALPGRTLWAMFMG
jgi:uncharacterized membrane protein